MFVVVFLGIYNQTLSFSPSIFPLQKNFDDGQELGAAFALFHKGKLMVEMYSGKPRLGEGGKGGRGEQEFVINTFLSLDCLGA